MKHIIITTIAAVVLVGCGPPPKDIWEAAYKGNIKAVKQFIAKGADVNAKAGLRMQGLTAFRGMTPLCYAATEGHKKIAELLIAKGADVNAKNGEGLTPLHRAAYRGHKEVAELLIAKGADVNAKAGSQGKTPLNYAEGETAYLLRKHGGKTWKELRAAEPVAEAATPEPPTAKAPDISIHIAARRGNIEAVKQHIAAGTDVNVKTNDGKTPLDWAIRYKRTEIADLLRKHGGKTGVELK